MSRTRGFVWLAAGLVLALLAAFVAYQSLSRATREAETPASAGPTVSVVAAARALPVRTLLAGGDLTTVEIPVAAAPEGAVTDVDAAVGKLTAADLYAGEILLTQRLVDPNLTAADGRTALLMTEDEVLVAIPAEDLMSRIDILQPGDHVDLLYSLEFPENRATAGAGGEQNDQQATFTLLQNVTVAGVVGGQRAVPAATPEGGSRAAAPPEVQALLLTLRPQDALQLKYARDAGGTLDIALRAPGADQPYDVNPVDVDYLIDRFKIPTGPGQ
jgi:pilus assembly protein CpaB